MNEWLIGGILSPVIVLAVSLGIYLAISREKWQKVYNVIVPVFAVSTIVSIICLCVSTSMQAG